MGDYFETLSPPADRYFNEASGYIKDNLKQIARSLASQDAIDKGLGVVSTFIYVGKETKRITLLGPEFDKTLVTERARAESSKDEFAHPYRLLFRLAYPEKTY